MDTSLLQCLSHSIGHAGGVGGWIDKHDYIFRREPQHVFDLSGRNLAVLGLNCDTKARGRVGRGHLYGCDASIDVGLQIDEAD